MGEGAQCAIRTPTDNWLPWSTPMRGKSPFSLRKVTVQVCGTFSGHAVVDVPSKVTVTSSMVDMASNCALGSKGRTAKYGTHRRMQHVRHGLVRAAYGSDCVRGEQ